MTSAVDLPADLVRAISHGDRILEWQEHLTTEEQPPQWMWPYEDKLTTWMDDVIRQRNSRMPGSSSDETVPMMSNELAEGRR